MRRLVLVGAGQAHLRVLERWARRPVPRVGGVIVLDRPVALSPGGIAAVVSGRSARGDVEIDAEGLAMAAGFEVVLDPLSRVDAGAKRLHLQSGASLRYDVASLNIGGGVAGQDTPGVGEHAVLSRPGWHLLDALETRQFGPEVRAVVVGGNLWSVELAACLHARWTSEGRMAEVTVVHIEHALIPTWPGAGMAVAEALATAGVRRMAGCEVVEVGKHDVCLDDGHVLPSDLTVWALGSAPPRTWRVGDLPHDADGFVRVDHTLAVRGCRDLFATGACARLDPPQSLAASPLTRSHGQAKLLDRNLRAALGQGSPGELRSRRVGGALVDLGDGTALGLSWWGNLRGRPLRWMRHVAHQRVVRRLNRVAARGRS